MIDVIKIFLNPWVLLKVFLALVTTFLQILTSIILVAFCRNSSQKYSICNLTKKKPHFCTSVVYTRLRCVIHKTKLILYGILCFVDRASFYNLFKMKSNRCTLFLVYLFQLLYMFQATIYPSSVELTVSMRHWYFSLCMGGLVSSQPADHIANRTEWKIPVSHRYSKFSWWWAHSCPKHVEKLK